ncbi:MAG: FixH family protein [Pseudomonadales bacterium]|nr:FixH family protein [Pseudomonadales bacterium]
MKNDSAATIDHGKNTPDVTPWYRQFWLCFIIGLPATVVIIASFLVIMAFQVADSEVTKNYYQDGLSINNVFEEMNSARAMQLRADIRIDNETWIVTLESATPLGSDDLKLDLQHPFDSDLDLQLTLQNSGKQSYIAKVPELSAGRWYIDIYPILSNEKTGLNWRLKSVESLPSQEITIMMH